VVVLGSDPRESLPHGHVYDRPYERCAGGSEILERSAIMREDWFLDRVTMLSSLGRWIARADVLPVRRQRPAPPSLLAR